MIVEAFMWASLWFNQTLAGFAPEADAGSPSANIDGWSVLMQWVVGAGSWVNVPAMLLLCGIAVSWYVATITFKLFRAVFAHVPFIGGRG